MKKSFISTFVLAVLSLALFACGGNAQATDAAVNVTVIASGLPASISFASARKFDVTVGSQSYTNAVNAVDFITITPARVTSMLASPAFLAGYVNVPSTNIWINSAKVTRSYCLSGGRSVLLWDPSTSETITDSCATDAALKAANP